MHRCRPSTITSKHQHASDPTPHAFGTYSHFTQTRAQKTCCASKLLINDISSVNMYASSRANAASAP
ncbi:unnamed protein product [Victoria cruziana]